MIDPSFAVMIIRTTATLTDSECHHNDLNKIIVGSMLVFQEFETIYFSMVLLKSDILHLTHRALSDIRWSISLRAYDMDRTETTDKFSCNFAVFSINSHT